MEVDADCEVPHPLHQSVGDFFRLPRKTVKAAAGHDGTDSTYENVASIEIVRR